MNLQLRTPVWSRHSVRTSREFDKETTIHTTNSNGRGYTRLVIVIFQALQTSLRQCRGSQISAPENRVVALTMARTGALPLKERAARVGQHRRSFAWIEKQAKRVAALEEQLAAEKFRLQKTRLNIQQSTAGNRSHRSLGGRSDGCRRAQGRFGRPPSRRINSWTKSKRPSIQNQQWQNFASSSTR